MRERVGCPPDACGVLRSRPSLDSGHLPPPCPLAYLSPTPDPDGPLPLPACGAAGPAGQPDRWVGQVERSGVGWQWNRWTATALLPAV